MSTRTNETMVKSNNQVFPFIIINPSQKDIHTQSRHIRSYVARKKSRRGPSGLLPSLLGQRNGHNKDERRRRPLVLSPTCSSLTGIPACLPDCVNSYMLQEAFRFLLYTDDVFYPPGLCLPNSPNDGGWFRHLVSDKVLLDALTFANEALSDHFWGRDGGMRGQIYHLKALKSLQDRISATDEALATSDPTIMAIVTLGLTSDIFHSDYLSMKTHLDGLQKIVTIRGGLQALDNTQDALIAKVCRVDIGLSLRSGRRPRFFNQALSWNSCFSIPEPGKRGTTSNQSAVSELIESLDYRLAHVWKDFKQLCQNCNISYQTRCKMRKDFFQDVVTSILYRLLNLSLEDILQEALRMGMIALACKLFLPWQERKSDSDYIRESLGNILQKLQCLCTNEKIPNSILLWLVIQWRVLRPSGSAKEGQGPNFRELLGQLRVNTWQGARAMLKSVLWVDVLNDPEGKLAFDKLHLEEMGLVEK